MKKRISLLSVFAVCLFMTVAFVGCGKSGNTGEAESKDRTITSDYSAVAAVKNYTFAGRNYVENEIADELNFNNYYDPQYGTTDAEQNDDGSWTVTLKGTMRGYEDEYHKTLKSKQFEVTARIEKEGDMPSVTVRQVY